MAQNISDTMITNIIDHMTAVTKGYVGSYTTTEMEDLFKILVKEQNPDDLANGAAIFEVVDDTLAGGTSYASIWASVLGWLNTRATNSGVSGLGGLLTSRNLRVPHTFDKYIYFPTNGAHVATANVFPDQYWNGSAWTTYSLGTYAHGDALPKTLTPDTLDTSLSAFWGVAKVTNAIDNGTNFVFDVSVTYADGSATAGTERVTCVEDALLGTYFDIGASAHATSTAGYNIAGQKVIQYASSAKFTVNQKILVWSAENQSILTTGAAIADLHVHVPVTDVGAFNISDLVYIDDNNSALEQNKIEDIDYENGVIYLTLPLAAAMDTAQQASIYKREGIMTVNVVGAVVTVSVLDCTHFAAGDTIVMTDPVELNTETGTVLSVNYATGEITLTGAATLPFLLANGSTITHTSDLVGKTEEHIVAAKDVAAANTITTTSNLLHTYNTANCKSVRLLGSIPTVATPVVSGTAGDAVVFEPRRERIITQGSIITTP